VDDVIECGTEGVENCEKGDTREISVSRGPLMFGVRFVLEVSMEFVELIVALGVTVGTCSDVDVGV
jgi:hypothetical protein